MSSRIDRFQAAKPLADLIFECNPRHREFRIEQAVQDIRDHIAARDEQGRRSEVADTLTAVFASAGYSVKVPLRLVKGDGR